MKWEEIVQMQLVNLKFWLMNCRCECKSCYEMRKSINRLVEGDDE
jgi:hypothetical protein